MNRPRTLAPLALCLVLATGACSGGDEPEAKPTKTSASPTPTVPVQPQGEFGVTYDVGNWDDYADDQEKLPVILAYKNVIEAAHGSVNQGKLLPQVRASMTRAGQRQVLPVLRRALSNKWTLPAKAEGRVLSVRGSGSTRTLTMCEVMKSISYLKPDGNFVVKPQGSKQTVIKLSKTGSVWKFSGVKLGKSCQNGGGE